MSDNIHHECVLGWDFLSSNGLDLKAENHRGSTSFRYYVHSRHGTSPVLSRAPSGSHTSGVSEQSKVSVLSQSQVRGSVPVTLSQNTVVPPHSEIFVEVKVARSADSQLGMVSPKSHLDTQVSTGRSHSVRRSTGRW